MYPPTASGLPPSRKDTILLMTILGWVVCNILCFVGYSQAKQDLAMIDAGQMDPRDRDTINTLKLVCLINMIMFGMGLAFAALYFLFIVAMIGVGIAGA